jgi:hypothetical protein
MAVTVSIPTVGGTPVSAANPLPTAAIRGLAVTETYPAVGTTSAPAIAANARRRFLGFYNNDSSAVMTFSVAATAVANKGITVQPGGSYVFEAGAVPTNAFTVIGSVAATVPATVLEG